MRRKTDFTKGWMFHMGEFKTPIPKVTTKTGTCGGASNLTEEEGFIYRLHPYMAKKMRTDNANHLYNVAKNLEGEWENVTLPHDFSIRQDYQAPEKWEDKTQAIEAGYLPMGVGYYRKRFALSAESLGKRVYIEFEGVMRDCTVWVNGCYIGSHLSGYTGFALDISDYLFYGEEGENVILVKADTSIREGWWAEGAGIYRPVWLYELEQVHVKRHGTFVYCENVSDKKADTVIETEIANEGTETETVTVRQTLYSPDNVQIAVNEQDVTVSGMDEAACKTCFEVENPDLWDLHNPHLYRMVTEVLRDGEVLDRYETDFGIRDIKYTKDGLCLNGRIVEIKGVCVHQDFAGVGTALTEDLIDYRCGRILDMGANAYRSAHHPASEQLLKACDRLGILVMNENRRFEVTKESLEDLEELIKGSRNHPCIFMWSLENEEFMPTLPNGKRLLQSLVAHAHKLDPTRQCTVAGHFACRDENYVRIPDVAGFNYDMDDAGAMRAACPELLTVASEDGSFVSTRGIYEDDREGGLCDSYDNGSYMMKLYMEQMGIKELPKGTIGGATSPNNLIYSWNQYQKKAPFLGGMFVWSGFDYRGETFPWNWPAVSCGYGAMDICGFEKDAYYYWRSVWKEEPQVHMLPHWNWEEGKPLQIDVYSNCEEVELFVNGKSQGRRAHEKGLITTWKIPYESGNACVRAYKDGVCVAEEEHHTVKAAADVRLVLVHDGKTEQLYRAEIVDENGDICPTADNKIIFETENGVIVGVGNGNPASHEPDVAESRRAFNGLALVIVQKGDGAGETRVNAKMVK